MYIFTYISYLINSNIHSIIHLYPIFPCHIQGQWSSQKNSHFSLLILKSINNTILYVQLQSSVLSLKYMSVNDKQILSIVNDKQILSMGIYIFKGYINECVICK